MCFEVNKTETAQNETSNEQTNNDVNNQQDSGDENDFSGLQEKFNNVIKKLASREMTHGSQLEALIKEQFTVPELQLLVANFMVRTVQRSQSPMDFLAELMGNRG